MRKGLRVCGAVQGVGTELKYFKEAENNLLLFLLTQERGQSLYLDDVAVLKAPPKDGADAVVEVQIKFIPPQSGL